VKIFKIYTIGFTLVGLGLLIWAWSMDYDAYPEHGEFVTRSEKRMEMLLLPAGYLVSALLFFVCFKTTKPASTDGAPRG
jgi:hypothetical protein